MMASTKVLPVSQLAFNILLVGYDFDLADRVPNSFMAVKQLLKVQQISAFLEANPDTPIPGLSLTKTEENLEEAPIVALWVGMRPSTATTYTNKENSVAKKGESVSKNSGYTSFGPDPKALRVVSPVDKKTASYYSLVRQENGVCVGYQTPIDEVFFFSEFRDDTITSYDSRKTVCGKKVREALMLTQKVSWPKDYDKTKFLIQPKRNFANELSSIIASYQISGNKQLLKTALDLISSANNEGSLGPSRQNTTLCKLTKPSLLSIEESNTALEELKKLAPDLDELNISAEEIRLTSQSLAEAKVTIEYRLLRAFLVDFVTKLRLNHRAEMKSLSLLATEARKHVLLVLGPPPAQGNSGEASPDALRAFVAANMGRLEGILSLFQESIQALKSSQGDHIVPGATLPQIWQKFGAVPDLDSAKLYAAHVHMFNVEALSQAMDAPKSAMESHIELLKKLHEGLADEHDEGSEN